MEVLFKKEMQYSSNTELPLLWEVLILLTLLSPKSLLKKYIQYPLPVDQCSI